MTVSLKSNKSSRRKHRSFETKVGTFANKNLRLSPESIVQGSQSAPDKRLYMARLQNSSSTGNGKTFAILSFYEEVGVVF